MEFVPLPENLKSFPTSERSSAIARRILHVQRPELLEMMSQGQHCELPKGVSIHHLNREELGGLLVNSVLAGKFPEDQLPAMHPVVAARITPGYGPR